MIIMIFLHGTAIMHLSAQGQPREERVRQVQVGEASVRDFAGYVPVDHAVEKLRRWESHGAEILYLSSHRNPEHVEHDESVLARWGFPSGPVYFRREGQTYASVVEDILPDVLIEDDCESIGGLPQMTYPHLSPAAQSRIKSIVVKEFGGIDHLPNDSPSL